LEVRGLVEYLDSQEDVLLAYLFGSVVSGRSNPMSDVDLAVLVQRQPDPRSLLERQLSLSLGVAQYAGREVDLVLLNQASPLMRYEVTRHGRVLYERRPAERIAFEVRARQRYFDLKPMLEFHGDVVLRRIEEVGLGRGRWGNSRALEAARRLHRKT
jgi:predicted nucleotidyltransferase